ncbi:MAG TPA: DNA polymerase III subunit delta [Phycisphaerales bacterium]|nr:DNA polymerase III subunit delta [Phycisphaerales bacterium]
MAKKAASDSGRAGQVNPIGFSPDPAWRIILLHGRDAFLRLDLTSQVRRALAAAHGEVDTVSFDGQGAAVADVLDECRSFGLMQQHKLIVVDNADQLVKEAARPLMERYAESPTDEATLLLRAERWNPGNLDKRIGEVGAIVKCDGVSSAEAVAWIGANCKVRHQAVIDRAAAQLLVDRLGADLGRIDSELGKLAVSAGDTITADVVAEMVGLSRQEDPWSIQSVLVSGDATAIVRQLRLVLENAPRDAHIPVVFAFSDLARKLHGMAVATQQRMNPQAAAGKLRLWGPARDALVNLAPRLRPGRTRALLRACVEADQGLKSGLGEPSRVLERLGLRFAAVLR